MTQRRKRLGAGAAGHVVWLQSSAACGSAGVRGPVRHGLGILAYSACRWRSASRCSTAAYAPSATSRAGGYPTPP